MWREDIGGRLPQVWRFPFLRQGSATIGVTPSRTLILIPTARRPSHILILTPSHNLIHPRSLEEMEVVHQQSLLEKRLRGQLHQAGEITRGRYHQRRNRINQFHLGRMLNGQYLPPERERGQHHPNEELKDRSPQRRRQDRQSHQRQATGKMKDRRAHQEGWLCVTTMTGPYRPEAQLPTTRTRECYLREFLQSALTPQARRHWVQCLPDMCRNQHFCLPTTHSALQHPVEIPNQGQRQWEPRWAAPLRLPLLALTLRTPSQEQPRWEPRWAVQWKHRQGSRRSGPSFSKELQLWRDVIRFTEAKLTLTLTWSLIKTL